MKCDIRHLWLSVTVIYFLEHFIYGPLYLHLFLEFFDNFEAIRYSVLLLHKNFNVRVEFTLIYFQVHFN